MLPCNKDKVTRGKPEKGMDFLHFHKKKYPIPTPKGGTTLGRSTTVNIWYGLQSHELPLVVSLELPHPKGLRTLTTGWDRHYPSRFPAWEGADACSATAAMTAHGAAESGVARAGQLAAHVQAESAEWCWRTAGSAARSASLGDA